MVTLVSFGIVTVLYKSLQLMTVLLSLHPSEEFMISCIYASNFQRDITQFREELRSMKGFFSTSSGPWIVMDDFKEILASEDHSHGMVSNINL